MLDASSHTNLNTEYYTRQSNQIEFQYERNSSLEDYQKESLQNLFSSQIPQLTTANPVQIINQSEYYTLFNGRHTYKINQDAAILAGAVFRINSTQKVLEIKLLAVSDQAQGYGIGTKIMQELKDIAQRQFHVLKLKAEVDSFRVGYYLKQGFKLIQENSENQCLVEYTIDDQEQTSITNFDYSLQNQIDQLQQTEPIYHYLITHQELKPFEISQIHSNGWQIDQFEKSKEICKHRFYKDCAKIIINMKKQVACRPFLRPVDVSKVLDYKDRVEQPMDIETIEKNMSQQKYQTSEEFINDVKLIFKNCYSFNKADSQFYKQSKLLERYTQPMLNMLKMHEPGMTFKKVCNR